MKQLILSITFIGLSILALAQPPHDKPPTAEQIEKMRAHKVAFITSELDLTTDEAAKFWPIYNEMDDKLHKLREEHHKGRKEKIDEMSDAEIDKAIEDHLAFRQKELDIEKEYTAKFKEVLPIKKVAKLHRAEQKFHRELIKKLGEKGGGNNQQDRQGPPPNRN